MPFLSKMISFWNNLFRRRQMDRDLDDELNAYVDEMAERKIQAGLAPEAAREAALLELGGVDRIKDLVRQQRVGFGRLQRAGMIIVVAIIAFISGLITAAGVMYWKGDASIDVAGMGAEIVIKDNDSSYMLGMNTAGIPIKELTEIIHRVEGVKAVAPAVAVTDSGFTVVSGIERNTFNEVSGGFKFIDGGWFSGPDEALVDNWQAAKMNLHVGDTTTILKRRFKVAGIVQNGKMSRIFIPIETLQKKNHTEGFATILYVKLKPRVDTAAAVDRLRAVLNGMKYDVIDVQEWASTMSQPPAAPPLPLRGRIGFVENDSSPAVLEGRIVNEATGEPVPYVEVGLQAAAPIRRYTLTDDQGHFRFVNPPAQPYHLETGSERWFLSGSGERPPSLNLPSGDHFFVYDKSKVRVTDKNGQTLEGDIPDMKGMVVFPKVSLTFVNGRRAFNYSSSTIELRATNPQPKYTAKR